MSRQQNENYDTSNYFPDNVNEGTDSKEDVLDIVQEGNPGLEDDRNYYQVRVIPPIGTNANRLNVINSPINERISR